jgi:hypothetical protein
MVLVTPLAVSVPYDFSNWTGYMLACIVGFFYLVFGMETIYSMYESIGWTPEDETDSLDFWFNI